MESRFDDMGMELETLWGGPGACQREKEAANVPVVLFKAVLVQRVLRGFWGRSS